MNKSQEILANYELKMQILVSVNDRDASVAPT